LRESLAQAEAAVRSDPSDGQSWCESRGCGGAQVFLVGFRAGFGRCFGVRCVREGLRCERVDPAAAANPDLHLNRATLLQYLERFQAALEGLSRAAELDPGWDEPRKRHGNLVEFLSRLCGLLANR
ncbi:TTC5 protein, partial [Rhagologus leucostigma]|nr:TTC5 protein [Rhagologus leucostigma]